MYNIYYIYIKAGDGGSGASSFRRERCIEFGGPDGGNGGRGGDIVFQADENLNTLIAYRYNKHYKAGNGERGGGRCMFGKGAENMILKVPVGTVINDSETEVVMAELTHDGHQVTVLNGGDGGIGNSFFKTSTNRAPRKSTPGYPGIAKWIRLSMKLIANVGLLGKPNAGKSSFLRANSNCQTAVADYAFTTLKPILGVIDIDRSIDQSFVVADLPGLIEGAANGKGLGLSFLKHVEKCEILLHIIDVSGEKSFEEISKEYQMIIAELEAFNNGLAATKKEIVAFNKIDMRTNFNELDNIKEQFEAKFNRKVFLISGQTGEGMKILNFALWNKLKEIKESSLKANSNEVKKPYFPMSKYKRN